MANKQYSKKVGGMVDTIMDSMQTDMDVTNIVEEVSTPTEGMFEGGTAGTGTLMYYSIGRPKGAGNEGLEFDAEAYNLVSTALRSNDNAAVKEAQRYLKSIGYYDGEVDGLRGNMTTGAMNRYVTNFTDDSFMNTIQDVGQDVLKLLGL